MADSSRGEMPVLRCRTVLQKLFRAACFAPLSMQPSQCLERLHANNTLSGGEWWRFEGGGAELVTCRLESFFLSLADILVERTGGVESCGGPIHLLIEGLPS